MTVNRVYLVTILKTLDHPLTLHIATKLSAEFSEKSDSSQSMKSLPRKRFSPVAFQGC